MDSLNNEQRLLNSGFEGVTYLTNFDYGYALIGVTNTNQAVYDYNKMVEWLMESEDFSEEEATEWISYNTERALGYMGEQCPLIMYPLD